MAKETIQIADKPTLDKILEFLLGDEAGLAVLKSLLVESAGKAESAADGLKEVNRAVDTISGYLMNNIYGLNAIKTAVSGRASESTSTAIKGLLENGTYGLNALKNAVTGRANETTVAAVKALLENGTYGLNALKTAVTGNVKTIKSVQSGLLITTGNKAYDVTISPVVISKTFVVVQGGQFKYTGDSMTGAADSPCAIRIVSPTTIQIGSMSTGTKLVWQVVEFY